MYTPVLVKNADGEITITSLRAAGNIVFGANLRSTANGKDIDGWYRQSMNIIGAYNQYKNSGNGYNAGYPFYGEHSFSGGFIYYGYYNNFHK